MEEQNEMTNAQMDAILEMVKMIVGDAETKADAVKRIERIQEKLKGPADKA